jgi:predicted transcriptional regulator
MSTDARPGPLEGGAHEALHASDVMVPVPRTCSPFSTVTEAALILKDQGLGMVPVVDLGKPVGIVSDRDVALAVADQPEPGQRPVSEVMSRRILTAPADTPIDQVLRMMGDAGATTLLVGDAEGLLLGVISWTDMATRLPGGSMPSAFDSNALVEVEQP